MLLMALSAVLLSSAPAGAEEIEPGSSRFHTALRGKARAVAHRTFIYERNIGGPGQHKRRFSLRGQDSYTVKATEESLLTAFQATLSSADGSGDIVLLFRDLNFVGWASNRIAGNLLLGRRGNRILVRYFVYRGRDSFCCPSGKRAVTYGWNGSQIVASRKPPLIYGEPGQRLHWGATRAVASSYWRKCGSQPQPGAGWYRVRAHGLFCGKARAVAKRYTYGLAYNPSPTPLGFSCQRQRSGYEVSRVACQRARGGLVQKVRFQFGA